MVGSIVANSGDAAANVWWIVVGRRIWDLGSCPGWFPIVGYIYVQYSTVQQQIVEDWRDRETATPAQRHYCCGSVGYVSLTPRLLLVSQDRDNQGYLLEISNRFSFVVPFLHLWLWLGHLTVLVWSPDPTRHCIGAAECGADLRIRGTPTGYLPTLITPYFPWLGNGLAGVMS